MNESTKRNSMGALAAARAGGPIEAVVIGASAGAIGALSQILPELPEDYPLPLLVVVHLPPDQKSAIAELFANKCAVRVKEAEDKEPVRGGTIYFAPPNYHLLVERSKSLSLSNDEPVHFSRPSIDVLFESAADAYENQVAGVILTGGNSDGARGLRAIFNAGGVAIVQSPETAETPAMPSAALEFCPAARKMELREISELILGIRYIK